MRLAACKPSFQPSRQKRNGQTHGEIDRRQQKDLDGRMTQRMADSGVMPIVRAASIRRK
jgi:hypothetical protein